MDFLSQLSALSTLPTFVGLVATASVIAIVRDWRFALWALLAQYILVGVLHLRMLSPELALIVRVWTSSTRRLVPDVSSWMAAVAPVIT